MTSIKQQDYDVVELNDSAHKFFGAIKSIGDSKQVDRKAFDCAWQVYQNMGENAVQDFLLAQTAGSPAEVALNKNYFQQKRRKQAVAERLRNKLGKKH